MKKKKAPAQFTHVEYDALEGAVSRGTRVVVTRRGTEYIVIPRALRMVRGREAIDAVHPTTGEEMTLFIDEMTAFEVVK